MVRYRQEQVAEPDRIAAVGGLKDV
jgi:hypothetical protein